MKMPTLDISLCVAGLLSLAAIVAVYAANPTHNLWDIQETLIQHANARVDDGTITDHVITALSVDPLTMTLRIHVNTKEGVVAVKGAVPNAKIGAHLLQLVAAVDGVRGVKNSLRVTAVG